MSLYVFDNNGDKVNEKINMIYFGDSDVYFEEIGNMYNLFDYFRFYFIFLVNFFLLCDFI